MWIIVGILVLLLLGSVLAYNTVVARKNNVENAFGAVEAELKKRRDLIPNLVEAVKAYRDYERELLERLVELREKAARANSPEEELKAEGEIGRLLPRLLARLEAYPDLKASANFLQLQAALTEVEDSIAAARRFYNQAVTEYNNALGQIPTNLFARMMGLKPRPVFTIPEEERKPPDLGGLLRG